MPSSATETTARESGRRRAAADVRGQPADRSSRRSVTATQPRVDTIVVQRPTLRVAFQDDLTKHIEQIRGRIPHVRHQGERSSPNAGEEATKQALVVPLLQMLGYDVFDPREVRPEYIADFAVKKAGQFEKVDYAVYLDGALALFVECKALGAPLLDNGGQLSRYFNADPTVRVGIITDGVRIRVYTDLQQPNIMDSTPWLDIDLLNLKPVDIDLLRRFRKADFVAANITELAEESVYYNAILGKIGEQLHEPSESFVRWVASELPNTPRVTGKLVERLTPILRRAIQSAIVDHVARSFSRPAGPPTGETPVASDVVVAAEPVVEARVDGKVGVVTTAEELEAARIVGEWIREVRPDAEFAYRDSKTYFTLHQNNVRKWFVRLGLDRKPSWVALRHVGMDEARVLAPGMEVLDGGAYGDSRLVLGSAGDLVKARAAVVNAYEREAARVGEELGEADGR